MKEKYHQKYDELIPIVDTTKSHKNYREILATSVPPKVPHLGVFLTDLIFINEGNKDVVRDRLINFRKHQMVYDVISLIRQSQLESYNLRPIEAIQQFLSFNEKQMKSDKELYNLSLAMEPREQQ